MHVSGFKRLIAAAGLMAGCMTWGAAMAAPQYRLVELPFNGPPDDPFNDTSAVAINRAGDTAVDFYGPYGSSGLHCTRTDCSVVPPLYVPHWPAVSAGGINDAGLMLATSADTAYTTHALVYDGSTSTRIYGLPDDFCGGCNNDSYGYGLNNTGQAVGSAFGADGRERAFIWQAGTGTQELGTLGGGTSVARAINDHGDVAGYSSMASGATHAFFFRRGRMLDVGTLGGTWSHAMGISDTRQIVGCSTLEGDEQTRAFVYYRGTITALPGLGGSFACGYGINKSGTIVGAAATAAEEAHGFVFDGEQTVDLNDQLGASDRAKWLIIGANAINHRGEIAATGQNRSNGVVRALLLRPRPVAVEQN